MQQLNTTNIWFMRNQLKGFSCAEFLLVATWSWWNQVLCFSQDTPSSELTLITKNHLNSKNLQSEVMLIPDPQHHCYKLTTCPPLITCIYLNFTLNVMSDLLLPVEATFTLQEELAQIWLFNEFLLSHHHFVGSDSNNNNFNTDPHTHDTHRPEQHHNRK